MKTNKLILLTLLALAIISVTITSVAAAPDPTNFGGNGKAWSSGPIYTNTNNGLIIHWDGSTTSPHHVGLTTTMPGTHSNGVVSDTALPGDSDVKPAAYWGPPAS